LSALPEELHVDGKELPVSDNWPSTVLRAQREVDVFWNPYQQQLGMFAGSEMVTVCILDAFSTMREGLALVEPFHFEIASLLARDRVCRRMAKRGLQEVVLC
jgi:hypothetical protein